MASSTTTLTGALYGTGVYGVALYDTVYTNVRIFVDGVEGTGEAGSVFVAGVDTIIPITGVSCAGFIGAPIILATQFNYNAVREQYGRTRTVYVRRKTTSQDRTIYISA